MLSLFFKLYNIEVHRAWVCFISIAVLHNLLDKLDNLRNKLRDSCEHIRRINLQTLHISEESSLPFFAELTEWDALLIGPFDYFIIDICDIHAVLRHSPPTLISYPKYLVKTFRIISKVK